MGSPANASVQKFIVDCNEVLAGKYLDLKQKLDKLMQDIIESEEIMVFLADSLDGYDFESGFKAAFGTNQDGTPRLNVPKDDKERTALTVSILNDIDAGKLNLTKFLETYFRAENLTPMQAFLNQIIRPFRDAIAKEFSVDSNLAEVEKDEEQEEIEKIIEPEIEGLSELTGQIKALCTSILSQLNFVKKQEAEDAEFVVNSLIKACDLGNLMVINGLVIGLSYVTKKLKAVKYLVEEMTMIIYHFYDKQGSDE